MQFTEETGIDVDYEVDVDDNNSYYGKVKDQLALGQDIGADTVCLTDWMVSRWIRFGYTQELRRRQHPEQGQPHPGLLNLDFDPGRKQSLPWQGGFAGICWNKEKVPGRTRARSTTCGTPSSRAASACSARCATRSASSCSSNGVDISGDWGDDEFTAALDIFREQVDERPDPQHQGQLVHRGPAERGHARGDRAGRATSRRSTPRPATSGSSRSPTAAARCGTTTSSCPIGSPRKTNAETLINYYYEPEVAAEVAAWVNYITPVVGAKEAAVDDRPRARREPADLPRRGDAVAGAHLPHARPAPRSRRTRPSSRASCWAPDDGGSRASPKRGADLELVGITKRFPGFTAIEELDLTIPAGSFFALLGPSGCGKTTTLRLVAGLEEPTRGRILIGGKDVTDTKSHRAPGQHGLPELRAVPAHDRLENVAFGLKRRGIGDARRARRTRRCGSSSSTTSPSGGRSSSRAASSSASPSPAPS